MAMVSSVVNGRFDVDMPGAAVRLVIGNSDKLEVTSKSAVIITAKARRRGRTVRWVTPASGAVTIYIPKSVTEIVIRAAASFEAVAGLTLPITNRSDRPTPKA